MTSPALTFRTMDSTRGLMSAGEGQYEFFHPLARTSLVPAAGLLLVLNGVNLNRMLTDIVGPDGSASTALTLLQMRAPREPIAPTLSPVGTGNIYRVGAKWRYSWYDSRTGQESGLSPVPDLVVNVGDITSVGSTKTRGQKASFYIPTASKPTNADTIRLYANSTLQETVWYLADQQAVGSSSYVLLIDNWTDDELFTRLAVVTGEPSATPAGPTWSEGVMWPVAKAWVDPAGRTRYFGLRRMGEFRYGTDDGTARLVRITVGDDLVTIDNVAAMRMLVDPARVGQRVRFFNMGTSPTYFGSEISDSTIYRFVQSVSATSFRIYPPLQVSQQNPVGMIGTQVSYCLLIEDDRDARYTFISEPRRPWLIDPLKTLAPGDDYDDGVLHWFSDVGTGRIFCQTKRRIYEALGSVTDDPSRSTMFVPVIDEGSTGLDAGCYTPIGWVYLHPEKGVRLFDGRTAVPLSGEKDPFGEFGPQTQLENFESSMLEEAVVCYDDKSRSIIVSYAPAGQGTVCETMIFSTPERVWRGPYREQVNTSGSLRSSDSNDTFVVGDSHGNIIFREAQSLDVVPSSDSFTRSGTVTSVQTGRIFSDSAATFDNSYQNCRGAPIWFRDSSGEYYFSRISDVITDKQLELNYPPVTEAGVAAVLTQNWTYGIGSIRWTLETAYLDWTSRPAAPVEFYLLENRFRLGAVSETYEAAVADAGTGTYQGPQTTLGTHPSASRDVSGATHGTIRLKGRAAAHQIRLRGTSRTGNPQITRTSVSVEEHQGSMPN